MSRCACLGSFLERFIQPAILLLLTREPLYGFSLHKKLIDCDYMDYTGIDPTGLYRMLKKMEEAGLLISEWDLKNAARTKRIYRITEEGRHCLANWGQTLQNYKKSVERLADAVNDSIAD
ncbi:MAG: helix-turn-helix transcriptional regulator [Gracilibacteraceae bacterium]|jgi:DNA-binding PadR family transcriptional regulator|nr:helix-turn-helix transcriptional regulator [Gracilibacteraceae bacterium]